MLAGGLLPLAALNSGLKHDWPCDLLSLLVSGRFYELKEWFDKGGAGEAATLTRELLPAASARFRPLYRRPRKIWGIGLNYVAHAADLAEKAPNEEPASFMKPDTTIIGPGDTIQHSAAIGEDDRRGRTGGDLWQGRPGRARRRTG